MKFMIVVKATPDSEAGRWPEDSEKLFQLMASYHEELAKAGALLDASGLHPSSKGWRIRYEPSATVMHLMGGGTGGIASAAALRSFNAYFARGRGPAARVALRALQVLGFALRAAAFAGASLVRREPALRARAGAHWRSLRLSLGGVR